MEKMDVEAYWLAVPGIYARETDYAGHSGIEGADRGHLNHIEGILSDTLRGYQSCQHRRET